MRGGETTGELPKMPVGSRDLRIQWQPRGGAGFPSQEVEHGFSKCI